MAAPTTTPGDGVHPSICRFCHANCGILVEVENGRAVRVTGDPENPAYEGFTCAKGRQLPEQHAHPDRLLHSQKRLDDGHYEAIASERAMDEIAQQVARIVEEHGPRSVAIYIGTYAGPHLASAPVSVGWLVALGSRMVFTASTIDQPGKNIANALHGRWQGGGYGFDEADAWMLVGNNPLVSMSGGIPPTNPGRRLRRAKERGQKLIVIDPRRTEVARFADVFLQPRPGDDPALLAAIANVIISEGLVDRDFVDAETQNFDRLAEVVRGFTPAEVARRVDVPARDIERAARTLAAGQRGGVVAGTGPNMAPRGNLTEYLCHCLNSLLGNWRREGEEVANAGVFLTEATPRAQAEPPRKAWGYGEKLRVRGFTSAACGLPTSALADEILTDGEGQIRALFCIGSNPVAAWPDQLKTVAAMKKLDLLVCLDMKMAATARLAHYVIAPKLSLEVPGVSQSMEAIEQQYVNMGYTEPYGQYAPRLLDPPEGSDLIEEWEFFYGLAQRMGLDLRVFPVRGEAGAKRKSRGVLELDMEEQPSTESLFEAMLEGSRVPLSEVKKHPHGGLFPGDTIRVAPREEGWEGRLELGDPTMLGELEDVSREEHRPGAADSDEQYDFRLVSRRMPNVYNSSGRDLAAHRGGRGGRPTRETHNPAFMNPADLEALALRKGDVVEIRSQRATILAIAEPAPEVREGVVSMSHCFGAAPEEDPDFREIGSNTGRLTSVESDYDPYTGIPRMSAIPVSVRSAGGSVR